MRKEIKSAVRFISLPTATATPTLQELSNVLAQVVDWHSLGVKLGVKAHELGTIEKNYHGDVVRCKHEMLNHCLRNAKLPTWKVVADALSLMGEREAALKIQTQYCSSSTATGMCLPHESEYSAVALN